MDGMREITVSMEKVTVGIPEFTVSMQEVTDGMH
jgi:hypothetical protein